MNNYKVSVLMSVYKDENPSFFEKSIKSILGQTFEVSEIVLIIDGPLTHELEGVIKFYKDNNPCLFTILHNKENRGLAYSLNKGLKVCKYSYVARMDTDDIATATRIEKQISRFQEDPSLDIVGSFVDDIDFNDTFIEKRVVPINNEDIHKLIWTNPIIHPTVMFKRDRIIQIGGYDESLRRRQDYELWFRASKHNFKFTNINESLLKYRTDPKDFKKKNNINVQYLQLKIGLKGCWDNKLNLFTYLGVIFNFIYRILPLKFQVRLKGLIRKIDPRKKEDRYVREN